MMKVIVGSKKTLNSTSSSWCLIQIPSGFDVNDVVLVNLSIPLMIYGIQLTWSVKPFVEHHTFDTCPPRSKERLEKLWSIVYNHFQLGDSIEQCNVMLAPHCEGGEFRP